MYKMKSQSVDSETIIENDGIVKEYYLHSAGKRFLSFGIYRHDERDCSAIALIPA